MIDKFSAFKLSSVKIALLYLILSVVWITYTDTLVENMFQDPAQITQIQTYKGWFFVLTSALLLLWLIRRFNREAVKTRDRLRKLLNSAKVGIVQLEKGKIRDCNPMFANLVGRSENELFGKKLTDLMEPSESEMIEQAIREPDKTKPLEDKDYRLLKKDGGYSWVNLRFSGYDSNEKESVEVIAIDISEKKTYKIYTDLLLQLILSMEPARDFNSAIKIVLRNICQELQWDYGLAHTPDPSGQLYSRQESWFDPDPKLEEYDKKVSTFVFEPGDGLAGLTVETKKPYWFEDVENDERFREGKSATDAGLKSVVSFPVVVNDKVIAVLMLFSRKRVEPDSSLLRFFSAIGYDIGAKLNRKREMERRVAIEESLNYALESAQMATWDYYPETDKYLVSKLHDKLLGLENEDQTTEENPQLFYKHVHEDDLDRIRQTTKKSIETGEDLSQEFRIKDPDGSVRWLWSRGSVYTVEERELRISGVITDITRRKELEEELAREEELIRKIFDRMPVMLSIYRPDHSEFSVNPEFERVTGWSNKEIQEVDIFTKVFPDPAYREMVIDFMNAPGTGWKDLEMSVKSGEKIQSTWTNIRLTDKTQIGIGLDITERKEYELEIKKTEALIRESRELLRKTFESFEESVIILHPETRTIIECNKGTEKIFGYSRDELIGQTTEFLHLDEENFKEFHNRFIDELEEEGIFRTEFRMRKKNGEAFYSDHTVSFVYDDQGEVDKVVSVIRDITEAKELELQLRRQRHHLSESQRIANLGTYRLNLESGIAEATNVLKAIFGFDPEHDLHIENWEAAIHPDHKQMMLSYFQEVIDEEKRFEKEYKIIRASDGEERWVFENAELNFDEDGNPAELVGAVQDITEQKRLVKELEENQDRLHLTTLSANVGLWEWHPQTGNTVFDEMWANLVGYSLKELQPVSIKTWNELVHPDDLEKFEEEIKRYFRGETKVYECEVRMKHKQGHWVWILDRGQTVEWDEEGNPAKLVGTHIDITQKKRQEKLLKEKEFFLTEAQRVADLGTYHLNLVTGDARTSKELEQILGIQSDQELNLDLWEKCLHPEHKQEVLEELVRVVKEKKTFEKEYKIVRLTNDEVRWVYGLGELQFNESGEPVEMIGTIQDITERKIQQQQLQKSRDRYAQAEKIGRMGHWEFHFEDNQLIWSDMIFEIFGLNPDEFELTYENFMKLVHPDDRKSLSNAQDRMKKKGTMDITYRLVKPNGEIGHYQEKGEATYDQDGNLVRISGTVMDITNLKLIEQELKTERLRFETAAKTVSDVIWDYDTKSDSLWWNEGIETVFGYERKSIQGDPDFWENHIYAEDKGRVLRSMRLAEKKGLKKWREKYRFLAADGEVRYVEDNATILRDEEGKVVRIIGALIDETAMKHIKKKVEEERIRFETIAKSTNDVLYEWFMDTGNIWWSDGWQNEFGFSSDEVEGNIEWWESILVDEERERVVKSLDEAIKNSEYWEEEYKINISNDEVAVVAEKGYFIRDDEGNVRRMLGSIINITNEKKAKEYLEQSREQYRRLFEQNPYPMWIFDPENYEIIEVNQAAVDRYGYSREEFKTMSIMDIRPEEDVEKLKQKLKEESDQITKYKNWTHLTKDGTRLDVEISANDIYYEGEMYRLAVVNDVTEQKRAEKQVIGSILEGSEQERKRIAKDLHDGLAQYLTAAGMNLEALEDDISKFEEKQIKQYRRSLDLVNQAINETRSIAQNLMPKVIQEFGLVMAVESLVDDLDGSTGIEIDFYQNVKDRKLSSNIELNLYRVLQEAINNAIRHGECSSINVQLILDKNELICTIEDNGVGFHPEEVNTEGLGLESMRNRVSGMSGTIEINSEKGKGTLISVIIPLNND